MAVREFAVNEYVQWGIGTGGLATVAQGAFTVVGVAKRIGTPFATGSLLSLEASATGGARATWRYTDDNPDVMDYLRGQFQSGGNGPQWSATDDWVLVAWSRAAGDQLVRHHKCVLSSDTWTHQNSTGTVEDDDQTCILATTRLNGDGDFVFRGRIAAIAVFGEVLNDAAVEALRDSFADWLTAGAAGPIAAWRFDQAATTTDVDDETGNGADQTALSGSTVINDDDPPGFSFAGGQDATPTPAPLNGAVALPASTVSAGSSVAPDPLAAVAAMPAAIVAADATVSLAVVAATVALPAPGASAGSSVQPDTAQTGAALPAVSLSAGSAAAVTTTAAVTAVPAATVSADVAQAVEPVAATIALPAASPSSGSTTTPTPVAATLALPATAPSAGSTASPDTVQAAVDLPACVVQAGGNTTIAPDAVAAAVSQPAATASAGATTAPSTLQAAADLPTATARLGVEITPDAIASHVAVGTPLILAASNVDTATLALVVTIPAATATGVVPVVPGILTPGSIRPTLTPGATRPTLTPGAIRPVLTPGRLPNG